MGQLEKNLGGKRNAWLANRLPKYNYLNNS